VPFLVITGTFTWSGRTPAVTNGNNPTTIEIAPSDAGFTTFGVGTWTL
jgi:hypothetical protein